MKISQEVRDYAQKVQLSHEQAIEAGMKEKSKEFKASGSKLYQKT